MEQRKKVAHLIVTVLFSIFMVLSIVALVMVSKLEQMEYRPAQDVELVDMAYGEICEVMRIDIDEAITMSGEVVFAKIRSMKLISQWMRMVYGIHL